MKKFLTNVFILLLPFCLIGAYCEYRLRKQENSYSKKLAILERNSPTAEILILGSSHALFGLDPTHFQDPALNLANVSQSHYYDQQMLEVVIDKFPKLHTVIVPVSYFSLDYSLARTPEKWRQSFYSWYFNIPAEEVDDSEPDPIDMRQISMVALFGVEETIKMLGNNFKNDFSKNQISDRGWQRNDTINLNNLLKENAAKRVSYHHSVMDKNIRPLNFIRLQNIVRVSRNKNVKVIFVTMPVYQSYAAEIDHSLWDKITVDLEDLCAREQCQYINHFTNTDFDPEDFFDSDHLNTNGAIKFSRLLANQLKQPEMQ